MQNMRERINTILLCKSGIVFPLKVKNSQLLVSLKRTEVLEEVTENVILKLRLPRRTLRKVTSFHFHTIFIYCCVAA